MANRDIRDIVGGLLMMAIGLYVAWHAQQNYDIGELRRMGPGFFPLALGSVLAVMGLLIALPAFFRPGSPLQVEGRVLFFVILSLLTFAFLLKSLGIILTTVVAVLIGSLAERKSSWLARAMVALGVAVITWVVFILGLGMILPVWPWSP